MKLDLEHQIYFEAATTRTYLAISTQFIFFYLFLVTSIILMPKSLSLSLLFSLTCSLVAVAFMIMNFIDIYRFTKRRKQFLEKYGKSDSIKSPRK